MTWPELYDIAVGDMGMTREQFERMEFGEFWCRVLGRQRGRMQELEDLRLVVWSALAPHSKKKLRPQDVFSLPGDGKRKGKAAVPMTKEMMQDLDKQWQQKN